MLAREWGVFVANSPLQLGRRLFCITVNWGACNPPPKKTTTFYDKKVGEKFIFAILFPKISTRLLGATSGANSKENFCQSYWKVQGCVQRIVAKIRTTKVVFFSGLLHLVGCKHQKKYRLHSLFLVQRALIFKQDLLRLPSPHSLFCCWRPEEVHVIKETGTKVHWELELAFLSVNLKEFCSVLAIGGLSAIHSFVDHSQKSFADENSCHGKLLSFSYPQSSIAYKSHS